MRWTLLFLLCLPLTAVAKGHAIIGQVIDRNGKPVERVNVALSPGNVEIITDNSGGFRIDYLRDAEGNRIKLSKKTEYVLTFFRVGYNEESIRFSYKRGELILEPLTLQEDSIRVEYMPENIDPSRFNDQTQGSGGSYEGE
jgi:hypothetical protein